MTGTSRAGGVAVVLFILAWLGGALLSYQRVSSPEPLIHLLLLLAWLGLFSLACLGAGGWLGRFLGGTREAAGGWLIDAGLGCAVLVAAAFTLSVFGWFRPLPLAAVLLAAAAVGGWEVWRAGAAWRAPRPYRQLFPFYSLLGLVALATLFVTATAAPFYDQFHYHLGFPYQWLRSGRLEVFPRHAYSFLPAAMGALYAYPLHLLGTWSAQAVHWWAGALAVASTAVLAHRLAGPRAAAVAAVMLATTPSLVQVSTWAAADLGATACAALAWVLIAQSHTCPAPRGAERRWLGVGIFAGLAAAAKLLALATVVVPVAVAALASTPRRKGIVLRRFSLLAVGLAVTLGPWSVRNLVASGDPFYPFGSAFLARLRGSGGGEQTAAAKGIGAGELALASPGTFFTLSTFRPRGEAGEIGPLHFGFLPLAVWSVRRARRRGAPLLALGAACAVLGWGFGPPLGRYLLPALPLLVALAAAGWRHAVSAAPRRARPPMNLLLLFALGWAASAGVTPVEVRRLACSLGAADGEELMRQYVTYWPAIRVVNQKLPPDAKLLLVGEARPYLLNRDVIIEDPFRRPLLVEMAEAASSPEGIAALLRQQGVSHLLVNPQEAQRIAALNGRANYLQAHDPAAEARLAAFFSRCLQPVFTAFPVEVFSLEGCPP